MKNPELIPDHFRIVQEAYKQTDMVPPVQQSMNEASAFIVVATELAQMKKKFTRAFKDGQPELILIDAFINISAALSKGKSIKPLTDKLEADLW